MRLRLLHACLTAVLLLAGARAPRAAVFVVDDVADPVPITGTLTLRQAITSANALAGPHQILFQIPGAGVQTITLALPLPPITMNNIWINGYSQPGASPGASPPLTATILVQLDGWMAGPGHGLHVLSSFNRIEGLAIMNFAYDGIRIEGTPAPGTRSNVVYGNFVGTDASGMLGAGNGTQPAGSIWAGVDVLCAPGPVVLCTDNTVERNLVSGNFRCGIQISSCPPSDCWANHVLANLVGSDVTGMLMIPNAGSGVVLAEGTHDNLVDGNLVSGNNANGVDITGNYFTTPPTHTIHNGFTNNLIGVAWDGVSPLGNAARGVSLGIFEASTFMAGFARANAFTANVVAYNWTTGISVWEHPLTTTNADSNRFANNAVHSNGALAIDLGDDGPTPNDPGDADTGANEQLNAPVVIGATYYTGGSTSVYGVVDGGSTVYVYRGQLGPAGWADGLSLLSAVVPDALGNWGITTNRLAIGDYVTALAVNPGAASYANTSEFAAPVKAVPAAGVGGPGAAVAFGLSLEGANPFRGAIALRCRLPAEGEATLCVHDLSGKLVRTVLSGPLAGGEHAARWDGRDERGREAPAGVYFVDFTAGERRTSLKVVKR